MQWDGVCGCSSGSCWQQSCDWGVKHIAVQKGYYAECHLGAGSWLEGRPGTIVPGRQAARGRALTPYSPGSCATSNCNCTPRTSGCQGYSLRFPMRIFPMWILPMRISLPPHTSTQALLLPGVQGPAPQQAPQRPHDLPGELTCAVRLRAGEVGVHSARRATARHGAEPR